MERLDSRSENQSLLPLIGKTSLLAMGVNRKIIAKEKIDTPVDEFGIPIRSQLIKDVLSRVEESYTWTGFYDLHHVAWPAANYADIFIDGIDIGKKYRESTAVQISLSRQAHNLLHCVTRQPVPPSLEVMRQVGIESKNNRRLYNIVKERTRCDPENNQRSEESCRNRQYDIYQEHLAKMEDGYLGIYLGSEYLSKLSLEEAREILWPRVRVPGLNSTDIFAEDLYIECPPDLN